MAITTAESVTIPLSSGRYAIVDACDFAELNRHKWSYAQAGYAVRRADGRLISMHRQLLPGARAVDHCNGNGLDNRRKNLREATQRQNLRNTRIRSNNTSGFKGISWDKARGKWQARIYTDRGSLSLGRHDDQIAAACAYNVAAKREFMEFARLNRMD